MSNRRKQLETKHLVKIWLLQKNEETGKENLYDCMGGKYHEGIDMYDCTTDNGRGMCVKGTEEMIIILDMADCIILHGGPINGNYKIPFEIADGKWFRRIK